jgi:hypothetical protein
MRLRSAEGIPGSPKREYREGGWVEDLPLVMPSDVGGKLGKTLSTSLMRKALSPHQTVNLDPLDLRPGMEMDPIDLSGGAEGYRPMPGAEKEEMREFFGVSPRASASEKISPLVKQAVMSAIRRSLMDNFRPDLGAGLQKNPRELYGPLSSPPPPPRIMEQIRSRRGGMGGGGLGPR